MASACNIEAFTNVFCPALGILRYQRDHLRGALFVFGSAIVPQNAIRLHQREAAAVLRYAVMIAGVTSVR
jgi:hypothetical protein